MPKYRFPALAVLTIHLLSSGCTEVQVPVSVQLTPFLIFDGYYVQLGNMSDEALTDVFLTYYDAQGNSRTQQVGRIGPNETVLIDPSEVNWRVVKHEEIAIHAKGHVRRVVETNVLIDQL